jgi:hypothetical protein
VVAHIAYREERLHDADECLRVISALVLLGWQVSRVSGSGKGPYVVRFSKESRE